MVAVGTAFVAEVVQYSKWFVWIAVVGMVVVGVVVVVVVVVCKYWCHDRLVVMIVMWQSS